MIPHSYLVNFAATTMSSAQSTLDVRVSLLFLSSSSLVYRFLP